MKVLSVNIATSEPIEVKNRTIQTGIFKRPVEGPVEVMYYGLKDDAQIEVRKLGPEHSAVYAYPFEHYAHWRDVIDRASDFPLGQFGENLTVSGLLETEVRVGDILRFGSALLQVAHHRIPCAKLNARMGLRFSPMFLASRKVGFYFRVLQQGLVQQGDDIELVERDMNSPTMEEFVRISHFEAWDADGLEYLLRARDLMPAWTEILTDKLNRARAASGWHGLRKLNVTEIIQESHDTFSFRMNCAKGKSLPGFRAGQKLMVVLGNGSSGQQSRQGFYLTSSPYELDSYRIIAWLDTDPANPSEFSEHLRQLKVGDTLLCNAAHGLVRSLPAEDSDKRMPVLISEGNGIAVVLGMMHELRKYTSSMMIFHQAGAHEPSAALSEITKAAERNKNLKLVIFPYDSETDNQLTAQCINQYVNLNTCNIDVVASKSFILRMQNEFMALDISPAVLVTFNID